MSIPKVGILFITYNHIASVTQALDSMLMQKTSFDFRIVAGDDCSPDKTGEILEEYARKYPEKFILSSPAKNIGAEKNFNQLLKKCIDLDFSYIAYLEGDDFWLDEYRLQKQFDVLESDPEVGVVYGKYKMMNLVGNYLDIKTPPYRSGRLFEDIITCRYLPSLHACMFRNSLLKEVFKQDNFMGTDFYLMAEFAMRKKFFYIDEYFFVYRQTKGSVTKIDADNVTRQFSQGLLLYKDKYPALVKEGLGRGGRILLYHQSEDNPSLKNLVKLFKKFEFSWLHMKQIVKWFLRNFGLIKVKSQI